MPPMLMLFASLRVPDAARQRASAPAARVIYAPRYSADLMILP